MSVADRARRKAQEMDKQLGNKSLGTSDLNYQAAQQLKSPAQPKPQAVEKVDTPFKPGSRDAFDSAVRRAYQDRKPAPILRDDGAARSTYQAQQQKDADQRAAMEAVALDLARKNVALGGRLSGHGMNLNEAEFQQAVARDNDLTRRTKAGAASVGYSFAGSIPSLVETTGQAVRNYLTDRSNEPYQQAKREAANVNAYGHGRLNTETGEVTEAQQEYERRYAAADALKTKTPVDPRRGGQQLMAKSRDKHAEAVEGLGGVEKFIADASLSILTNAPAIGVGLANPAAGLTMMGVLSAASKTSELNARGINPSEALIRGVASGAIEAFTEKLPLDNLADIIKLGGKPFVIAVLKQSGVEGAEEAASYLMNFVADAAANDPEAVFSLKDLAYSAGLGAASGLVFGTAGSAIGTAINSRQQIAETLQQQGVPAPLALKQGNVIHSIIQGMPISGNDAATIARSPQAIQFVTELTGQQINTNAPISEVKAAIKALPAPAPTQANSAPQGAIAAAPVISLPPAQNAQEALPAAPTDALSGTTNVTDALREAANVFGANGRKAMERAYTGNMAPDVFFGEFAKVYNAGKAGKTFEQVPEFTSMDQAQAHASWASGQNDAKVAAETAKIAAEINQTTAHGKVSSEAPLEKQAKVDEIIARNNETLADPNPKEESGAAMVEEDGREDVLEDYGIQDDASRMDAARWSAQRAGSATKAPMRLSDIVEKIRYDFGLAVTTGHIRKANVRGQYNPQTHGIRSKVANNLPTIAHELGHHLDNLYKLTKNLDSSLKAELENGLSDSMKAAYPEKKWKSEGLAEFLRKYLQNKETAAIDYPLFTEHFLVKLSDKDRALIDSLADEVNAYYSMDAETAGSAIRFKEESIADFRSHGEKIKDVSDEYYQAWIDGNHGIKLFDQALGSDTYKIASNSAYSDAVAYSVLTGDLTDMNGQRVGDGLFSALSEINAKDKTEYRALGEYLVVKHGPERLREGMRVFADDRKNSSTWMRNRQQQLEEQYPQFKEASEKLYKFQSDFLRTWGVGTGLVSSDSAKEWAERWEYYVPFNRAVGKRGSAGAKRGFANQNSTIKKAKGSGLDFVHPVDNIINNIVKMVNAGLRNNVMAEITKAAEKTEGTAVFLEKVPMPLKKKTFDAKPMKENLRQAIMDAELTKADEDKVFDIIEGIDDILVQFGRGHAHGDVITVLRGGKQQYWKINDAMLLESITNMSPLRLPAWLEAYGLVSKFMTINITGVNIVWSLFSNAPRDLMTYFTYSKDRNPLNMLSGIGLAYLNKFKGVKADPLYKEYLAMGGGRTSVYTADLDLTRKIRRKMSGDKLKWLNPIEWVEFVSDTIETGPRFSYYRLLRNKGFDPQEAFFGSMDITVNFRRGGPNSRSLNKVVPFFNAGVQGLDKFARWISGEDAAKGQRAGVAKNRTVGWVAASIILAALSWAANSSDDEKRKQYERLSAFTKNNYWNTPLGDGKYFSIPKPREIGVLSSMIETSVAYFANGNEYAFDGFHEYFTEMTLPNVVSDVAKGDMYGAIGSLGVVGTLAYMMSNKNFLGQPIVSESLRQLEPKDQFTRRTSKMAYWMGQAFNVSPQMADFFFQQTLGGFWKSQRALFPVGEENIDPTLGVLNTYVKDNLYSTDIVNRLYDRADAASRAKKSHPDDIDKAIKAKWYDSMTGFYSNYNKVAKEEADNEANRLARLTVIDMLDGFVKSIDQGYRTETQKKVEEVCRKAGDASLLPYAVPGVIKDDKQNTYQLTGKQYVEYQTEYLGLYWDNAEAALKHVGGANAAAALSKIKDRAAETAKANALKRLNVVTDAYRDRQKLASNGVDLWEEALYRTAYGSAEGKPNGKGGTISGSKQDEVIRSLDSMYWLTNAERDALYRSSYGNSRNNPYS